MTDGFDQVDTIIFDLDGVLVDVSGSYRRAVKESVEIVYGQSFKEDLIQRYKDLGGFNNDWKVTYACALYVLTREHCETLSLDSWVEAVRSSGKGLEAAEMAIDDFLSGDERETIIDRWSQEKLRSIFQELYLGSDDFSRLENRESTLERPGYIHSEPVIVNDQFFRWVRESFNLGVLTGRPREEAEIALERIGWDIDGDALIAMEDWDKEKPSPDGLLRLAETLNASNIIYTGDTLDDVRTAKNATESDNHRQYFGVGVLTGGLSGEEGREKYKTAGAASIINSINDLPSLVEENYP
ncbi:MAG: TIGR01548 family HAD-type hydrolase [bacterium]